MSTATETKEKDKEPKDKKPKEIKVKKVRIFHVSGVTTYDKNEKGEPILKHNLLFDQIKTIPKLHNRRELEILKARYGSLDALLMVHPIDQRRVLYDVQEYVPSVPAYRMDGEQWMRLAGDVLGYYENYDGFVILHEIDTLAYTASALSFLLLNLGKPVILTGSLIFLPDSTSDAIQHIMSSLLLAGWYDIPEVAIFFGDKLFRGNRTTRIGDQAMGVFRSNHYPRLAEIGSTSVVLYHQNILPGTAHSSYTYCSVEKAIINNVLIISTYPKITAEMLSNILRPPVKGVVLQCFRLSSLCADRGLLQVLKSAIKEKIVIVSVFPEKRNESDDRVLKKIGVVSAQDMTTEAAYCKLCCILGKPQLPYEGKCKLFTICACGEFTTNSE